MTTTALDEARDAVAAVSVLGIPTHPAFTGHPELGRLIEQVTALRAARQRWWLTVEEHSRAGERLLAEWAEQARTAALADRDIPPRPEVPDPPPQPLDFWGEESQLRDRAAELVRAIAVRVLPEVGAEIDQAAAPARRHIAALRVIADKVDALVRLEQLCKRHAGRPVEYRPPITWRDLGDVGGSG